MHLQAVARSRGRLIAPQLVDQPVGGHHATAHQRQQREQRPRPLTPQRYRSAIDPRLDRTEQLDPKPVCHPGRHRISHVCADSTPHRRPQLARGWRPVTGRLDGAPMYPHHLRFAHAPGGRTRRWLAVIPFVLLALAPAAASADPLTVDFETGPALGSAVAGDYLDSAFVRFDHRDPAGGFRPYRRSAPGLAHSGTVVADVGSDVCYQDTGATCEFVNGATTGRLTRTATAVTLFAGEFDPSSPPATARLTAFRADGTVAATSADVMIDHTGFNQQITVSSAAGDIAYFHLATVGSSEGDLGFDDLTLTFPAHSLPDVAVSVTNDVVSLLQGNLLQVPIGLSRLNDSSGPLEMSVSGLPAGVSAWVTETGLVLQATRDAPAFDLPVQITISADPQGHASAAPAVRTAQLSLRLADPYELKLGSGASTDVALPDCAPVSVPLVVERDRTFASGPTLGSLGSATVKLSVNGLPPGVSAQIKPSDTVSPGGGFFADRTIEFSRSPGAALPGTANLHAYDPATSDLPGRFLFFTLRRAAPVATVVSTLGLTPRFIREGTEVRIDGNGFCPGTSVLVGNAAASTTVENDHTLRFTVPRLATSGPVKIVPPGGQPSYTTTNSLTVANVRNTDGFQFSNYGYGSLSISELTKAFGADDLFFKVNPCWPWGDCTVVTGILNPLSVLSWGVLNVALHASNGHCFGISRAVQQLVDHKEPYASFSSGSSVFTIPGPAGPGSALSSYLDAEHAVQGSEEFLSAWFDRDRSIAEQVHRLEYEFGSFREPIIALQHGTSGHAVIAYNERNTPVGVDIDVYDNNRPASATEAHSPALHAFNEDASVIHVNTITSTWTFDLGGGDVWTGHDDGTFFVMPRWVIPDDPTLPGLGTLGSALRYLVFGSADGSVRTAGGSPGAQYLPPLDDHALPGGAGWWISRDAQHPLEASFDGLKNGHYTEAFTSPGFVGSVKDVTTAKGVHDKLTGSNGTITFTGGTDRALNVELAQRPARADATAWSATLNTHATAHGSDTAGLAPGGALSYAHAGAPTTLSLTLTSLRRDGGPSRFISGPVKIGRGDRATVTPIGRDLASVRLQIRGADGKTTTRTLRNRTRPAARLALTAPKLAGRRASVTVRIAKLRGNAKLGASLRLVRGKRVLAHLAKTARARNGRLTFTLRLPRVAAGRYRLLAGVRVFTIGQGAVAIASVSASRGAVVAVR